MCIAREHVHGLYLVARDFPFEHFTFRVIQVTLLDKAVTLHHNELLELRVVPMLSFGDARLADIDTHLPCIQRMHQLRKRASLINVHLQWERHLLLRQVAQVGRIELFFKTLFRYLWYH